MDLDELIAREAIRDLVSRYNAGADGGRFDEVLELFAPDAVMDITTETFNGRDEIERLFRRTQQVVLDAKPSPGERQYVRHFTATLQIDIEGPDTARSRCYYQVIMAHGLDHWGRYIDRYKKVDGKWRFAQRKVTTDGRTDKSVMARP